MTDINQIIDNAIEKFITGKHESKTKQSLENIRRGDQVPRRKSKPHFEAQDHWHNNPNDNFNSEEYANELMNDIL